MAEAIWFASVHSAALAKLASLQEATPDSRPTPRALDELAFGLRRIDAMVAFALQTSSLTASKAAFAGKSVRSASSAPRQVGSHSCTVPMSPVTDEA